MPYSMAPLLMHSQAVPAGARDAIRAAHDTKEPEERREILASAGRILLDETELDCHDVRELLDLPTDEDCGCDD
jgi:hypothetical protein